jgi:hypothetical protein
MRKKTTNQKEFRKQRFPFAQYWNLNYTEKYRDGSESDFKVFIKAKSYVIAKEILRIKLKEDDASIKIKSLQGFMFHKDYAMDERGKGIGVRGWEQIRTASFPNENNVLFKLKVPRKKGYTNRFNKSGSDNLDHIKSIGFKKGDGNWSKLHKKGEVLAEADRANKIYRGHWIDWDPDLRKAEKDRLISALVKSSNNRSRAAEILKIGRNTLYAMFKKFPEIDFNKEYPAPKPVAPRNSAKQSRANGKKGLKTILASGRKPFGGKSFSPEANIKRGEALKNYFAKKRKRREEIMEPLLREALSRSPEHSRVKAAKLLEMPISSFRKQMYNLRNKVNWSEEYPTKYSNEKQRH